MGTRQESPEKDIWWINELESLGVTAKPRNNLQEISSLIENIKQIFDNTYESAYNAISGKY